MSDLSIDIIYEDKDILAINKPAGLIVHADGRSDEPTVSGWLVDKYPEAKGVGEKLGDVERPGIVHRLDRDTSGVLLLAKTDEGHASLKEQFQNREIKKKYNAFVYGDMKKDHGMINLKIERSKSNFRKRIAGREGKDALTYYIVLKRSKDESATFVEVQPRTGRTHQIRVHFRSIHYPIVSDKLYASGHKPLLGFKRLALHARSIVFKNLAGEKVEIEASYPEDFVHAIDIISQDVVD